MQKGSDGIRRSYNDQELRYSDPCNGLALATELAINQNLKPLFNRRLKLQIYIILGEH